MSALPPQPGEWKCAACGHVNPPEYKRCHGCEQDREEPAQSFDAQRDVAIERRLADCLTAEQYRREMRRIDRAESKARAQRAKEPTP